MNQYFGSAIAQANYVSIFHHYGPISAPGDPSRIDSRQTVIETVFLPAIFVQNHPCNLW
jgi:hypothetical protein